MNHEQPTPPEYTRTYARIYPLAKLAINTISALHVNGAENIPDRPAIYAANHNTVYDPLWLALAYYEHTHQPLRFLAKKGYFDGKGIDDNGKFGRITKTLVHATGQIPVDRENGKNDDSIDAAVTALNDGSSVGIFPEGSLSVRGELSKLRSGIARIALRAENDIPIVPVAIAPKDKRFGRSVMSVTFGEPIDITGYDKPPRKFLPELAKAKLITDNLEAELAELTGYARTGKYAKPGEVRRRQAREKGTRP